MSELRKVLEEALRLERAGEPGVLVTLVDSGGSTPRHGVARMVVHADGSVVGTIGGGALEHGMVREGLEQVLPSGEPVLVERDLAAMGMTCGGRVRVLLEPVGVQPRLVVFGAGHVAAEVVPLAARCGFSVHVVDDRSEFASAERFPEAASLVCSFDAGRWEGLRLGPGTFAVVITRGHEHDFHVVRALVERDLAYLGMMGSRKKVAEVRARLAAEGVSGELIDRIHAPIGLPIPSETPAEIAVSIVGELIEARRRGSRK
jgi:xanthine dehydrogenase accessory factor